MVYFYLIVPFKKIVFNAINILNYLQILEHQQRCITVVGKPSKRDKNLISGESDYWC